METNESSDEKQPRKQKRPAGIFISKQTLDTILRQKTRHVADMIALLNFYHYTALWQGTNQPRASVEYVARGLALGRDRVRAARSLLLKLGFIKDIPVKNSETRKVTRWVVQVRYFHPTENQESGSTLLKTPPVAKSDTNALRANRGNASRADNDDRREALSPGPASSSIPSFEEAENDPLWKPLVRQFKQYCESKRGSATNRGWKTWAGKQPRPKPKPKPNNGATPPPPDSRKITHDEGRGIANDLRDFRLQHGGQRQ